MDEIKLHHRINLLNADYARCIDDDRMEEWPGFFVEDCLYKITTADNHARGREAGLVYADSRAMLQDRVSALREANIYERQRYRHMTGVPTVLDVQGEAHSLGRSKCRSGHPHHARRQHGRVRHRPLPDRVVEQWR
jgi:anthranilate 1,2-dioxygenase small subunit/terephthalate 1,2-dioxygenase oxygenase component beta subunit